MLDKNYKPTATAAWQKLDNLALQQRESIAELFARDSSRAVRYRASCGELLLDYSKNRIDDQQWQTLLALAEQSQLAAHRDAMFAGDIINTTEQRAVLHSALRARAEDCIDADAKARQQQVSEQLAAVKLVSDKIRAGKWLGSTGKSVTDIVNIGIGGSDLGPRMVCAALEEFAHPELKMHFIANVDGAEILSTLKKLNPETTLVAIASKTFTTQETLLNAKTALDWFRDKLGMEAPQRSSHFVALTASRENALAYGIPDDQILEFAEWVGGRYSLWSSIGLSIAVSIGFERFEELLNGAREMDLHFQQAPFAENMPVILALLGIWYSNFVGADSHAVIPYCERLGLLPSYLQQLDMESNGKSTALNGDSLDYRTGPIIWGQTGTNGQHAFFQLMHQGCHLIPVDFIAAINDDLSNPEHHRVLLGNMLAQSSALMSGQPAPDGQPWRYYPGNRPSNVLLMDRLTPHNLGMLIALYEHKVFVQGSIWGINSFDQWGVELGKKMANQLLAEGGQRTQFDDSTEALFRHIASRSQ